MNYRIEKDSMGRWKIPSDKYYGIHTQRSYKTFQISGIEWHPALIIAITRLKLACAEANNNLGMLSIQKKKAIVRASRELIEGKFYDQFPLDIFQTGSGTATNMNVNEVIAHRASELLTSRKLNRLTQRNNIHPNDDVNKGQSTNDVIPSAIRIACINLIDELLESLVILENAFSEKGKDFSKILKSARTHLQDAVPITLGQEFTAYNTAIVKHKLRIKELVKNLSILGIGGNAVGTGLNTKKEFRREIIRCLNKRSKHTFYVTQDGIESIQFLTDIAVLSGILKALSLDLYKIANDLRLLNSGPRTGLHEINIPPIEPGSSIMPGKINPAVCEAVGQVSCQIVGNDAAIAMACASGNLNLNTYMPIIGHNIVNSLQLLTNVTKLFAEKCVSGITANKDQCQYYAELSAGLATALNPVLGYDIVEKLVKESLRTGKSVKELALEKRLMTEQELNRVLDPNNLT